MSSAPVIRIDQSPFDPEAEAAAFRRAQHGAGAVVTFLGIVRAEDQSVARLTLESYPDFTAREIARIADEAAARWRVDGVLIIHRVGSMAPGEPIVLVAAAAAHRRDAFEAVNFLMDYLKSEAPFWKRETTATGDRWIEPRPEDHDDKKRWAR